jgi:GTPase-associated protein 1, N-terminal domain type 2/GTPase-associated protein 1, middle domain
VIGRIEYTSCEDGVDGIRGFQIRAMTPDIPDLLRTVAVRDSVYEPPPGAPSMPEPDELARFPVAFGYSHAPEGFALYRANYVGRDHTGRWGNYFAQALAADRGEWLHVLPIDFWESPVWRPESTRAGLLAGVRAEELVTGTFVGPSATATFLTTRDRYRVLAGLLAVVRDILRNQGNRLVLIAEDSATAAQWISAVTRSLPASLAWSVTFTTFTSRPESHSALLTFTTPDVSVPTYGNYRTVDLRQPDALADAPLGEYERVVAELWPGEEALRLVQSAPTDPPLQPNELDRFVRGALLFETFPVVVEWQEPHLLDGLEFAMRRSPASIAQPWDQVAGAARDIGEIRDVPRWSGLLREAVDRGARVPGPLIQLYVRAAVQAIAGGTVPGSTWIPTLDEATQAELADRVVVPALQSGPTPQLLDWLTQPAQGSLRDAALDHLAAQAESTGGFESFATTWSSGAADAIAQLAGRHPRLKLASEVALARAGALDPVDVATRLSSAALPSRHEWSMVALLLWPNDPPTVSQAEALLHHLPTDVLSATGLAEDHIVQRLLEDCAQGLTADDHRLARRLGEAARRDGSLLSEAHRKMVDLIALIEYFDSLPPYADGIEHAAYGVGRGQSAVAPVVADQFNVTLARWLLQLDWNEQRRALRKILLPLAASSDRLFEIYADSAAQELATAKPERVAELITAWRRLASFPASADHHPRREEATRLSNELLESVLARGLARASQRQLDRIGESPVALTQAGLGDEPFQDFWTRWQRRHERQGLLARFRGRGRG